MRRTSLWSLVALAILVPATASGTATPAACLGVVLDGAGGPELFSDGFESGDTSRWEQPAVAAFSTRTTADLGVFVELDPLTAGEHLLELRWRLPGGELYESVAVPFAEAGAEASTRRVPGYPFPLEVAPMRPAPARRLAPGGSVEVASRLPLAGTSIVDSALWGEWSLEIHLDGAAEACLPPLAFRLEP